ncbi:MAG: oligosaccharide flippase family protein [Bacteroidales bacterium]|nr:oligosaccharide flippase family protein [Bacteroidales bacterium]
MISGLFWVLLLNIIVKPLWFLGIEVGAQNAVGNEAYGLYFTVFNLAYILNILLDLGVTNFNTRNIARHPQLIAKHMGGILTLKLLLFGLYALFALAAALLLGYGSREFSLLMPLCVAQFLNSLILYLRSNFEGLLLFKWDSFISVMDRLLMILLCGLMLWTPLRSRFNIYWFVYAQVLSYALTAVTALLVIAAKSGLRRLTWNLPFSLVILRQSAPFALLVLLMASYNRIDPILLRMLSGDSSAGVYAGAFRLLDAFSMVAYLVSVPLLPVYARLCKTDVRQTASTTRLVFFPMLLLSLSAAVVCNIWATPIMTLLYHGNAPLYVPVFRVIICGFVPICVTYIFGTLLTAAGKLRQLNLFAVTALLLNVAVNLVLIPRLGAVGSAWASLSAQLFMALAQIILAFRLLRLPLSTLLPPSPRELLKLLRIK